MRNLHALRLDSNGDDFVDLISGWEISVTLQTRTPLQWLQRHREFHGGPRRPAEVLPPEHACWVPVIRSWRDMGIDEDELPEATMASQIGQVPVDGGTFLPFLIEYRKIVEGAAAALGSLGDRHPAYRELLTTPTPRTRRRRSAEV